MAYSLTISDVDSLPALDPATRSLTAAIASGDTEAFARFFDLWFEWMRREAGRATGRDESFCLDVVQDSMMRVIRSMKPMPTEDDLRRWLGVVVRSCAYDRLRAEARARARQRRGHTATPAEYDMELHSRIRWIEQELRSMSSCNAELLLMRYRFGWTLQQIANALGLKTGAVDGRLRRLIGMLRRHAGEQHDE